MQALLLQEQRPEQIELSILLAAEAMKRRPSFEATKALKKGLQLLPQTLLHIQRTTSYTRLVASADGSHIVAAGEAGLVGYSMPMTRPVFISFMNLRKSTLWR